MQVSIGVDPSAIFAGAEWALMIGAKPRGPGMERADLLDQNGRIFKEQVCVWYLFFLRTGQLLSFIGHPMEVLPVADASTPDSWRTDLPGSLCRPTDVILSLASIAPHCTRPDKGNNTSSTAMQCAAWSVPGPTMVYCPTACWTLNHPLPLAVPQCSDSRRAGGLAGARRLLLWCCIMSAARLLHLQAACAPYAHCWLAKQQQATSNC
jgi:hypothetical protein